MIFEGQTKSIPITKTMVWEAYLKVRSNRGGAGVDGQCWESYDANRSKELYKLWNRLASGSYFPPPVKRVEIPKADGKKRPLGIPTVSDRVAQQVIKAYLEPRLEKEFLDVSYGYRPNRGALEAVAEVRKNVKKYPWVIDLDIQSFFDNVSHDLIFKSLDRHVTEKWVLMYIRRWLESPIMLPDGKSQQPNGKGTPQGGVVSPLLANLFLHYCLDKWLARYYPETRMVRHADDLILHCRTERESKVVLTAVKQRLTSCGLTAHPEKTKIAYCMKAGRRKQSAYSVQFDFLGFSFRPIMMRMRRGGCFLQYDCMMSRRTKVRITGELRALEFHNKSHWTIQDLSELLNPKIRGWINYYGKVHHRCVKTILYYLHHRMLKWVMNKYKRFKRSKVKAADWLRRVCNHYPYLFYHWTLGWQLT
ncbi:group II intron reverse transcriptase/maturase [Mangrovibacterium marinum]|uniref:Group II intron reverse transcriptase/maturase n=1 Tax=Mangrovibacterium marinum TaxID=1639118 RepID=A0A2T5BSR4_9BACT|nr:group II intron reverse transcriptase/maturase [Mangrovibacterium marinum]PTN02428.1 group II intron reverse transcriptase/maturase [Mangrovibacterium marinum]